MKNLLAIIPVLAFFLSVSSFAQINDSEGQKMMQIIRLDNDDLAEVKGSHYLDKKFQSGKILIPGQNTLNVFLRYNINTETFEIKTDEKSKEVYELPINLEPKYHLNSDVYTYRTINFEGNVIQGYFKNLHEGKKVIFLEKPYLTVTEAVKARTGFEKDKPAQISLQTDHYLVFPEGKIENVKLKKKDFEKAFSNSPQIKKYFSDNKVKTVEDFTGMVQWYDNQ